MACDPATLVNDARCIDCAVPPGMELAVLIVIAANLAGVAPDPAALMADARCIECGISPGMQMPVLLALACQLANQ